ncbi:MAG: glycosyltransferase [Pseudomonadota bacterium]
MKPKISVIIPVFEHWQLLEKCLTALEAQTFPSEQFEVVVVDNEAEPRRVEIDHGSLNLRVVHEVTPSSYAARNCGIEHARGDIFAFTDADSMPAPAWLQTIATTMEDEAVARLCGPVINELPADNVLILGNNRIDISGQFINHRTT